VRLAEVVVKTIVNQIATRADRGQARRLPYLLC
jgi:hypothetical protein